MKIQHKDFYRMNENLEENTLAEWVKVLEERAIELLDDGNPISTAMMEAWSNLYELILEDSERWNFYILDLRERFFDGSIGKLREYQVSLNDKEEQFHFYITKNVGDSLDGKLLIYIQSLIESMNVEKDYLQVFEISGNTLTHSQEEPEYSKEYKLNEKYENGKLFCIRTAEEESSFWTLMFAYEY
ncbi:hypothetical protein PM10SUCC1_28280 [Propionigenium maris DSM 9537]|uniref:Uncharacterized protein n=1 Tax=Propionigenium maris DSM 9537 TaxID=1123000 RepID=A0A9W6GNX9_9FUSO|nr:DUF960 family protein [Propionigenium maris]GLI57314.1 hypothetical protein PM10SUCC1_28280 [Propionigenium maris DSM 9537]